ncbi:hypothetical protein LTS18_000542, partial [Coniosporium uncinatum]
MGRTESSKGLAPPAYRKDQRAKFARMTINKTIPTVLASNARARKGVDASELIVEPPPLSHAAVGGGKQVEDRKVDGTAPEKRGKGKGKSRKAAGVRDTHEGAEHAPKGQAGQAGGRAAPLKVRLHITDTLTAAFLLQRPSETDKSKRRPKVAVLNMASPLRPGGGVFNGAT